MKLLILGGSGGVGRHLVAQAALRGHDVVALVRPGSTFEATPAVQVVRADPLDAAAVAAAMDGRDAVASSLGMKRVHPINPFSAIDGPHDFNSASARVIVAAMRAAGVSKVVAVSAAGVAESASAMNAFMRLLVATSSVGIGYRDLAVMEQVYADSGLDWCCVRPVTLTDGPLTGRVGLVERFGATMTVSRADVAAYVLDRVEQDGGPRLPQIARQ